VAAAILTHRLSKSYGNRPVVSDLDLHVPEGCVYGFLGPNGSGKSTTMKMLLSLVRPTRGEIHLLGRPMRRDTRREILRDVGSLIETPPGYGHLTGGENLRILQRLVGLDEQQVDRAVRTVRLQDQLDKQVRHYSLGMKQRLGIAMALAREPRLLVLDEPTNGLDPAGIEEIRVLLTHLAERGVTVLVSSHLLGEIDRTSGLLGILRAGRLLFQGSREELLSRSAPDVLIDTSDPLRALAVLGRWPVRLEGSALRLSGATDRDTAHAVASLVHGHVGVHGVRREQRSLEDVFLDLTAGAEP
jgi:ABC-type multidrug transport system ATPase subunit